MTEAKAGQSATTPCPRCGKRIVPGNASNALLSDSIDPLDCTCNQTHVDAQMSARFSKLREAGEGTLFLSAGQSQSASDTTFIGLAPGAVIGGLYEIIGLLGRGGMGEVYLAKHLTLNKRCALKVIPPDQVTDSSWQRFQFEAKTVARLDHVNLVRVTDLGIHEQCLPFYAMEYLEGKNLAEMLSDFGPMPLVKAVEVFVQVCDGLDVAHRNDILHRDLKPANIMLTRTTSGKLEVKVLDFGLAKLTVHDRSKQSLTAVGDVFGSPSYMSPEQCGNEELDNRSDIYSIGCTLFEALTGRPPFNSDVPGAVFFGHLESEPPTINSVMGEGTVPLKMETIMAKLLRKNPDERYQTLGALKADLLPLLGPKNSSKTSQSITAGKKATAASLSKQQGAGSGRGGARAGSAAAGGKAAVGVQGPRSGVRLPVKNIQHTDEDNIDYAHQAAGINKALFGVAALLTIGLAGGLFYFFAGHQTKSTAPGPSLSGHTASAQIPGSSDAISDVLTTVDDAARQRPDFDTVSKTFTANTNMSNPNKNPPWDGKRFFRGMITDGNVQYRRFVFPKMERGCSYFEYGPWPSVKQAALTQEVLIPAGQPVSILPVSYIASQPFMLKGLSDGDFDEIDVLDRDPLAFSTALGVFSRFKSVTSIRFGDKASWDALNPEAALKVAAMLNQYPNLQRLVIIAPMDAQTLAQIRSLKALKEIRLEGPQKDLTNCLLLIAGCPRLESLAISNWNIPPAQLATLKACTNLRRIHLGGLTGSHEQLALLANLHQLSILEMPALKYRPDLVSDLKKLSQLKELRFSGIDLTEVQLNQIRSGLPGLKLTLYRNSQDLANNLRQP